MSRLRLAVLSAFLFACSDRTEPAGPPVSDSPDEVTLEDESSELEARGRRWTSPILATAHGPRSPAEPPPSSTRPRRPSSLAEPRGREHRAPRAGRRGLSSSTCGCGSGINGRVSARSSTTSPDGPVTREMGAAGRLWERSPSPPCSSVSSMERKPDNNGGPKDVPGFDKSQLQMRSLPAYQPEIAAAISYVEKSGTFADGAPFQLRDPAYALDRRLHVVARRRAVLAAQWHPRCSGLGLLEAVQEHRIVVRARPLRISDRDGISGRPRLRLGRRR